MTDEDVILKTLNTLAEAISAQNERLDTLQAQLDAKPTRQSNGIRQTPTVKAIDSAPEAVKAILAHPDDELMQLEQGVTRASKASMIKRAAAHSPDALRTYICAGGKPARAFMDGTGEAVSELIPGQGLVPGFANHAYAIALLQRIEGTPATKPVRVKGSVRGSTASQATKRASKAGGKL